ncbi:unnamed protein product [Didymodactylos carnosus]|uniref:Uncharacterized protein n=1 Tax=Didymodactylos carnosus TaxID=1234261 RepID=A0A814A446_9BILA|nr:unnamed protein product [Didymodactylos carnosus]CAF0908756.1 unnamed protein product [Didymodactylos carnosus]CAF3499174.1 unnamed protein product [Didymodactylos carnosus]CAF3690202.1 unnamed protein product [Didymodactylos carnosus]
MSSPIVQSAEGKQLYHIVYIIDPKIPIKVENNKSSTTFTFNPIYFCNESEIQKQLDIKFSKFNFKLLIIAIFSIISALFNVVIIYRNFIIRFITGYQHNTYFTFLVYTYEFTFLHITIIYLLAGHLAFYCKKKKRNDGFGWYLINVFISLLNINLFSILRYITVKRLVKFVTRRRQMMKTKYCFMLLSKIYSFLWSLYYIFYSLILLILVLFSIFVKLNQISFVGQLNIYNWTINEWLIFFFIFNNLMNLCRTNEENLGFLWNMINVTWNTEEATWVNVDQQVHQLYLLYKMIYSTNKWKGLLYTQSLDAKELHNLIRKP